MRTDRRGQARHAADQPDRAAQVDPAPSSWRASRTGRVSGTRTVARCSSDRASTAMARASRGNADGGDQSPPRGEATRNATPLAAPISPSARSRPPRGPAGSPAWRARWRAVAGDPPTTQMMKNHSRALPGSSKGARPGQEQRQAAGVEQQRPLATTASRPLAAAVDQPPEPEPGAGDGHQEDAAITPVANTTGSGGRPRK